ncbi:MAG: POT family proton-dependent oligopeptide transporter [Alteromonas macleodii]|jgi:POT family proton-dependent oligopeptide transporter
MTSTQQQQLFGHPAGLFILFFTEMWERFSYYGMRALLVLFLISGLDEGGWAWEREDALKLYAMYTGLVYLTPIFGGLLADKVIGFRKAVLLGAFLMTCGHAAMAFETEVTFYLGLFLLIIGNGAFKPNISSIVGNLYPRNSDKKDSAYTIFYMGINAGAFLGILLCGYIGEKVGWSFGFGLAGIFMFLGMLQFYFAQGIFGKIGLSPRKDEHLEISQMEGHMEIDEDNEENVPANVERDRLMVIGILSVFTIFFWMAFEQAGGSMTIFAKDYTNRVLTGGAADNFRWFNAILTFTPMGIVTYVLISLFRKTFKSYALSNIFLGTSFVIIWGVAIWMVQNEFSQEASEVPASWFGILNSFFIIAFAPVFSKIWESKLNPSASIKFALGLILLGLGFGVLAFGSASIPSGAATASVSMIWLVAAYFFHTMGELTLSPVGLSYVSKLAPARLVGLMFGVWFLATAVANYLAGWTGSLIDKITEMYSMSTFFLIYTGLPIGAGIVLILLTPMIKRKMHGIH